VNIYCILFKAKYRKKIVASAANRPVSNMGGNIGRLVFAADATICWNETMHMHLEILNFYLYEIEISTPCNIIFMCKANGVLFLNAFLVFSINLTLLLPIMGLSVHMYYFLNKLCISSLKWRLGDKQKSKK